MLQLLDRVCVSLIVGVPRQLVPALLAGRLEIQPEAVFYFCNSEHAVSPIKCRGLKVVVNHHFLVGRAAIAGCNAIKFGLFDDCGPRHTGQLGPRAG